jgi:hypothetical protein
MIDSQYEKIAELSEKPVQYHQGLVVLGKNHQTYNSYTPNKIYNFRVISSKYVQNLNASMLLTMKVQDN